MHGLDLVALQLDIAQGMALPPRPPPPTGHAIEARLYAEDPADGYRPASGTVHALHIPDVDTRFAPAAGGVAHGLRLDSGVEAGSEVSPHYDPMLAKLIAWAPARETAARMLASALDRARMHGPATNRALLASVLRHPVFLAGRADTSLLDGYDLAGLVPGGAGLPAVRGGRRRWPAPRRTGPRRGSPPACRAGGATWSRSRSARPLTARAGRIEVAYLWPRDGISVVPDEREAASPGGPGVIRAAPDHAVLEVSGVRYRFDVAWHGGVVWVDSAFGHVALTPVPRLPGPGRRLRTRVAGRSDAGQRGADRGRER